jgi:hypothetical protein
MKAQLDLIPSPLDRLDPVARVIRWWTNQMSDLFGQPVRKVVTADDVDAGSRRLSGVISVALSERDTFVAHLTLPRGDASAHSQAIGLRLRDLAPIDPAALQIIGTASDVTAEGAVSYVIAMARRQRLDELERAARKQGAASVVFHASSGEDLELPSPASHRKRRRLLIIDAGLAIAVASMAAIASNTWAARINADTAALADQERSLRRAAVQAEATRRNAEVARALIDRGVLYRRAGSALSTLATLNAATPDTAWWTSVRWTPEETGLSLLSIDATAAIESLSRKAPGWSVELAGPISSGAPSAQQSFDLKLRPREGGKPD